MLDIQNFQEPHMPQVQNHSQNNILRPLVI